MNTPDAVAAGPTIRLNGHARTIEADTTVLDLLRTMGIDPSQSGIAVGVNVQILHRSDWASTVLAEGDEVEIVTATQGG